MSDKLVEKGPPVGAIFGETVNQVRRSMLPVGTSSAVDLKMSFKSIHITKEGWQFIVVNASEKSSSIEIELTTRIHTDDLTRPSAAELVVFVQEQLRAEGAFNGPATGIRTAELDEAIRIKLKSRIDNASPALWEALRLTPQDLNDPNRRFVAYMQICLGESAYPVDGQYGPNTEFAFVMRRKDRPVI